MPQYQYLIVGGGMTGDAAIAGIREVDPNGPIGLLGAEPHPPYNRPPLSKGLWKGAPLDRIWRTTDRRGVDLHLGRIAVSLDPAQRRVTDDRGAEFTFDTLLVATGGTPRRIVPDHEAVIYFRTLDDYHRLRALATRAQRVAVVGGGFIGSEIAAALTMNRTPVTLLVAGPGIGSGFYPPGLSEFVTRYYRERGVEVLTGERAASVEGRGDRLAVRTTGGREVVADGVVVGIGITPAAELAETAGLETRDGILVDEHLRTRHPAIYAAGDVARYFSHALGTFVRVEHEDNANRMGRAAGRAMAGHPEPYRSLPCFYSDLFDLGYEAVGELDVRGEVVEDWADPYHKGVVYYLRDGRVRGVLLWNTWGQVDAATQLVAEPGPFRAHDLRGRLVAS